MKKILLMLMLTVFSTALLTLESQAQVTMYRSAGYTVTTGNYNFDTCLASATKYFITPVGALNGYTNGKYRINVSYHPYSGDDRWHPLGGDCAPARLAPHPHPARHRTVHAARLRTAWPWLRTDDTGDTPSFLRRDRPVFAAGKRARTGLGVDRRQ